NYDNESSDDDNDDDDDVEKDEEDEEEEEHLALAHPSALKQKQAGLGMATTEMVQDQGQHKLLANALTLNS
ncbi:hypothetical protein Tco_1566456, partial [Tanacetum coccineum]